MICLTGDVHHMSLCTKEAKYLAPGDTEVQMAVRYVELLAARGIKATLYITGQCFTREGVALRPVVESPQVEVGGHGYWARQPRKFFDWYGRRTGLWNGPRWFQDWDIRTNLRLCQRASGYRPVSWRAHSYITDRHTYPLLARHGVQLVSDRIEADTLRPYRLPEGLISHPLNVIPDHDHLYHAHRTPEFVAAANRRGYGSDAFGAVSYRIEEWTDLVMKQSARVSEQGGIATILAHPICMGVADGFRSFQRLLDFLATRPHCWAREIPGLLS